MGVWIEILARNRVQPAQAVTPYVGVWIEISDKTMMVLSS